MFSYALYFSIFALLLSFTWFDQCKVSRNVALLLAAIGIAILWLVAGGRFYVGTDYITYQNFFDALGSLSNFSTNVFGLKNEIGVILVAELVKYLGGDFTVYSMLFAFLQAMALFCLLRSCSHKPNFALFAFYCLLYFSFFFNVVRQGLAVFLFALAYVNFLNSRKKSTIIYLFLAFCFHRSAILLIPFIFLKYLNLNKNKIIFIVLISLTTMAVLIFFKGALANVFSFVNTITGSNRYANYLLGNQQLNILGWLAYELATFIVLLILLPLYSKVKPYYNMVLLGLCLQVILMPFGAYVERLSYYLSFFIVLLIPECLSCLQKKSDIFTVKLVVYGYLSVMFIYMVVNNSAGVIPYHSVFFS